jgi:hypothetical protein
MTSDDNLKQKMQVLMYELTKLAARDSYQVFFECCGISEEEYQMIKFEWKENLGIEPYV